MKKIFLGITTILLAVVLNQFKVYATGGFNISMQEITLHPGESISFTITASNSVGRIDLSSSDTNIASINTNAVFLDLDSEDITVMANDIGSTTILITATSNFATYDEEILEGQSYTVMVNVVEEPQPENDAQNTDITNNDQNEQNNAETLDNTANTPDTGSNSQANDGSNQIILSSIIGTFFAIASFAIFYLYKRVKTHQ